MKKINVKVKTIIWLILLIVAVISLILCSITIHNGMQLKNAMTVVQLDEKIQKEVNTVVSYCWGFTFLSIIIILMGSYIVFAGFKSWNYQATV